MSSDQKTVDFLIEQMSGAKPYFLISTEKWDDNELLNELVVITASQFPLNKVKIKLN